MPKVAVVLFNLGGPDSLRAVRPFLFNLFNDPAIIAAPGPVRWLLAQYISRSRAKFAQASYARLGGGSPLLANTQKQADALQGVLSGDCEAGCFIAMRHWRPFAAETANAVKAFGPDRVVLLPLYPQFSATTSGSAIADWTRAARRAGLDAPTRTVCCYPEMPGFVDSVAALVAESWTKAAGAGTPRVLFSAHGLPKRNIAAGDPYRWQTEISAAAIAAGIAERLGQDFDWIISYQSRVGRLEWIGPYTEDEIKRAADNGRPLVVVPIAFVSEHVETLVELDVDYRDLANELGVPAYERVRTVNEDGPFIAGLAALVRGAAALGPGTGCGAGGRLCPSEWAQCPCMTAGVSENV